MAIAVGSYNCEPAVNESSGNTSRFFNAVYGQPGKMIPNAIVGCFRRCMSSLFFPFEPNQAFAVGTAMLHKPAHGMKRLSADGFWAKESGYSTHRLNVFRSEQ
jgi:hypothetical protein